MRSLRLFAVLVTLASCVFIKVEGQCANGGIPPMCCANGSKSPYCCENGSMSPYCCANGSMSKYCCGNGSNSPYCCENGAMNPKCSPWEDEHGSAGNGNTGNTGTVETGEGTIPDSGTQGGNDGEIGEDEIHTLARSDH